MNDLDCMEDLSALDRRFGEFIGAFSTPPDPPVVLAAALTSRAAARGDVCLDLARPAGLGLPAVPPLEDWMTALQRSPAVGTPGEKRPLILDDHARLYLYRYWQYEHRLARDLCERADRSADIAPSQIEEIVQAVFEEMPGTPDADQRAAAVAAGSRGLTVITGGPGSGKTYTIAAVLEVLRRLRDERPLRPVLAAPTGKAAARLQESLRQGGPAGQPGLLPEVTTIHRLLQPLPGSTRFRHDRSGPLGADAVIVDEASMVDLALMAKLADAVPADARLILVGDKNQLASVEAGSVLGDVCGRGPAGEGTGATHALGRCIVELTHSYRFPAGSDIGELSRAVNAGDAGTALEILAHARSGSVEWLNTANGREVETQIQQRILEGCRPLGRAVDPGAALAAVSRFKILCAHASGPGGVEAANRRAERLLQQGGRILAGGSSGPWYSGLPLLVTRNDYALRVFNGDIGVVLPDPATGTLFTHFPGAGGESRRFLPQRLPEHATAYALTVHKSQGSEFEDVLLLLPDRDSPILTRELIYTALTRARRRITVCGRAEVIAAAVERRIRRASGLYDSLWGGPPGDA
jgi:exodeoxyribonuclease V alpha subunit